MIASSELGLICFKISLLLNRKDISLKTVVLLQKKYSIKKVANKVGNLPKIVLRAGIEPALL
jgi:hypothetical protein